MVGRREKVKKLVTDFRIVIWIVLVVFSLFSIFSGESGVVVKAVASNSPLKGKIFPGDVITWINEKPVKSVQDVYEFNNFSGVIRMKVNNKLVLADVNKNLGIEVEERGGNLKFGLDIGGGVRVLLEPVKNVSGELIEETKEVLKARINVFGLKEAKFNVISVGGKKYIQIEMAGGSISDIKEVLEKQGMLEAKIPKTVELVDNKGYFVLGRKKIEVMVENNSVMINNTVLKKGERIEIEGIEFEILNITEDKIVFAGIVFNSTDVKKVCMVDEPNICRVTLFYNPKTKLYEFSFEISISLEAAERMKKLTQDMRIVYDRFGRKVLKDGYLLLYLDNELIDMLSIDPGLKGKIVTQAAITGARESREEAKNEMKILQTVLSSGVLPVELKLVQVDEISPVFGEEFLKEIILIAVIAQACVAAIIFLRYRNPKIAIPMIIVSASEVIIILGIACWINWTIDLPSLAGIIAIVGTGVDAQIMIVDEIISGRRKIYSIKEKIKHAFFIIFSSAATTFVAMLPLLTAGAKEMQGFAVTTIIGLFIAVFITRPAFGKIIEEIL